MRCLINTYSSRWNCVELRIPDYGSGGWGFKSLLAHHKHRSSPCDTPFPSSVTSRRRHLNRHHTDTSAHLANTKKGPAPCETDPLTSVRSILVAHRHRLKCCPIPPVFRPYTFVARVAPCDPPPPMVDTHNGYHVSIRASYQSLESV